MTTRGDGPRKTRRKGDKKAKVWINVRLIYVREGRWRSEAYL